MSIKLKEIERAVRDYENIISDLSNANNDTFQRLVQRFVKFSNDNSIINKIIDPLLKLKLDYNNILIDHKNGWGTLMIPVDIDEQIAVVLQIFKDHAEDRKKDIKDFAFKFFHSTYDDDIYKFNTTIIQPALRELINKINDFIEDEFENKENIELSSIRIFNVGSISNQSGNVVLGDNAKISQENNIQDLPNDFLKLLLKNDYSYQDFEKIKKELEELKEELLKKEPNKSFIKTIFDKVLDIGGKTLLNLLVNLISKPEITTEIIKSMN